LEKTKIKQNNDYDEFVEHMKKITCRIIHTDKDGVINGFSSGFIFQNEKTNYVITAGHGTKPFGCFIEKTIIPNEKVLLVNAGKFNVHFDIGTYDIAYSILPVELIKKSLKNIRNVDLECYKHNFINASKNEAYGFAVENNHEFRMDGKQLVLPRYVCFEVFLELEKQDEHFNYFRTSRKPQPDYYYSGASGSPIADPAGKINSILIGGTEPRELLRAFRLDNFKL
jgi:hypothetical protein